MIMIIVLTRNVSSSTKLSFISVSRSVWNNAIDNKNPTTTAKPQSRVNVRFDRHHLNVNSRARRCSVRFGGIRRWVALFVCVGFSCGGFSIHVPNFQFALVLFCGKPAHGMAPMTAIHQFSSHASRDQSDCRDRVLANELAIFLLIYPTNRIL